MTVFQSETLKKIVDTIQILTTELSVFKEFSIGFNKADDDLFLHRKSSFGLCNIVIHQEDLVAFSFISKSDGAHDELIFCNKNPTHKDYRELILTFFRL